jgi:NADPH2:quinone reductase
VGRKTFIQSLDCLRKHGVMVSFGNASGPVDPVALSDLTKRGSLYLTRPTLFHFIDERSELEQAAGELFELVTTRQLRINVQQRYALRDTAQAHRDLEQRKTTGSTVLLP